MVRHQNIKLAPSILSVDPWELGDQISRILQTDVDYIHVDVMDGHFVPNMAFGPSVVQAIRKRTNIPLDVHLMVEHPETVIDDFAKAGASNLTIHVESCVHLHKVVEEIKSFGIRAGVALNPGTAATAIQEIIPDVDMVLVMTVNPGFPAQSFIPSVVPKLRSIRLMLDQGNYHAELEVDGGIKPAVVKTVLEAGATVLVAGSAIFDADGGPESGVRNLRATIAKLSNCGA